MSKTFKSTIESFRTLLINNNFQVTHPNIYNGDKEFGTFFIWKDQYSVNDKENIKNHLNLVFRLVSLLNIKTDITIPEHCTFSINKDGINIQIVAEYNESLNKSTINFQFTGKEIKSQKSFVNFPDIVPGTIFRSSWGYDKTIADFFQVVRRSGDTIYTKRIYSQRVEGDGWSGYVMPEKDNFFNEEVFRSKLESSNSYNKIYCRIDNHLAKLWDGTKQYFNDQANHYQRIEKLPLEQQFSYFLTEGEKTMKKLNSIREFLDRPYFFMFCVDKNNMTDNDFQNWNEAIQKSIYHLYKPHTIISSIDGDKKFHMIASVKYSDDQELTHESNKLIAMSLGKAFGLDKVIFKINNETYNIVYTNKNKENFGQEEKVKGRDINSLVNALADKTVKVNSKPEKIFNYTDDKYTDSGIKSVAPMLEKYGINKVAKTFWMCIEHAKRSYTANEWKWFEQIKNTIDQFLRN